MRTSESLRGIVARGLERRRERAFLAGCLLLPLAYAGAVLWFRANGDPVDRQFHRRREVFLMERLAAHPLPPGARVAPAEDGRAAPGLALLDGWSSVEPGGIVWSDGPVARFGVRLPDGPRFAAALEVAVIVNLGASGRQGVTASVNGRPAGAWDLRTGTAVLRLDIPPAALTPGGGLVVALAVSDPHSPSAADRRRLGVALRGVTLVPEGGP